MRRLTPHHTIQTCEGDVCSRCRIAVDHCQCTPGRMSYRGTQERISAQGWVPETETREAA